ncbi:hypothetical protein EWM64_g102 [Hericium alpestre]|uniref:Uncharacterized protein n=1 Tax=Hericium alpestre TaxID=135208 RepID=A0A4Z0ACL5_9AGAM|nr:hypothetical protein EWM64_g102 [Hericium alpestre]
MSVQPPFKTRRLSQAAYDRYATRSKRPQDVSNCDANSPKLKIVAETEDIKEVLRESSGVAGQDWILVPYDPKDSIAWVMQRVEETIKVPTQYWNLAGDGTVFWEHKYISELDYFQQPQTQPIELVLISAYEVDNWLAANRKPGRWKRFPHQSPDVSALPANPHARAQALFPLLDTSDSPHWAEYITHRQAAEAIVDEKFEGLEYDDNATYWHMISSATLESLNGEDNLAAEECKKIADAVANVNLETEEDEMRMRDADVITRIHSLVSPKSVDMHFNYHYRTRMGSVEWRYSFGFRINEEPVAPLTTFPNGTLSVNRMHSGQGWKTLGWFYLDNKDEERCACSMSARDLKKVHGVLFGPAKKGKLGERMSLRGTAKLMLASVGIGFDVALDKEDEKENGDGHRGHYEARLELSAGRKSDINAAHIRKICGIPPLAEE